MTDCFYDSDETPASGRTRHARFALEQETVGLVPMLVSARPQDFEDFRMPARDKEPDQKRIVEFLAEESRFPVDEVAALYERERAELAMAAHVTSFLHIFAIRNVQAILRRRNLDSNP